MPIEIVVDLLRLLVRMLYPPRLCRGTIFRVSLLEVLEQVGQMEIRQANILDGEGDGAQGSSRPSEQLVLPGRSRP